VEVKSHTSANRAVESQRMVPDFPQLRLPVGFLGPESARRRAASVVEATAWPSGPSVLEPRFFPVSAIEPYRICLGKPGKEAAPDYPKRNENDMLPSVILNGQRLRITPSFTDIFNELQVLGLAKRGADALELIAALMVRGAFMVDHKEVREGQWRYSPSSEVLDWITEHVASMGGIPPAVYIHLVDSVAWNEDVKYYTLGYDISQGYGRRNNLLTCAHIAAVFLGKASIGAFGGAMASRRGIAPLSQKRCKELFPLLS
jgi:hypothetical protein